MKRWKWIACIVLVIICMAVFAGTIESQAFRFSEVNGGYDILIEDRVVGGVRRYEIEDPDAPLGQLIRDAGIFDFDKSKVDYYVVASSLYGDWQLNYGTKEKSMRHDLFIEDTYFYEIWMEETAVEPEHRDEIVLYFAENILPLLL